MRSGKASQGPDEMTVRIGGAAGRFIGVMGRFLARSRCVGARPRLQLVERIALAPRQWLILVEAEGRTILVATSAEGGPAFYPLDPGSLKVSGAKPVRTTRVSW